MATKEREKRKEKREKRTPRPQNFSPISSSLCELCVSVRNFLFLFILLTFSLHAQNLDTSRSTVVKTPEGLVIRQIISFPALENIFRYEIEIEELQDDSWVLIREIQTSINSFEVTLAAGYYRYRYTAYNRMNLYEGRSGWQDFQLLPAIAPSPESYQPFYGAYYEMSDPDNALTVYGSDFSDKTEFALVKRNVNYDWSDKPLQGRKDVIIPNNVELGENQVRLSFLRGDLKSGTYQIFARNPGGLWVCFGEVRVGFHTGNDFLFEYGYSLTFSENGFFNHNQFLRIGWFPLKTGIGNFGIGGQLFWGNGFKVDAGSINLLYQYAATERLQHNVRLGFSVLGENYWIEPEWGFVPTWIDGYNDPDTGEWIDVFEDKWTEVVPGYDVINNYFYINFGYSVQYFFWKNFFATAGIDFLFAPKDTGTLNRLYINPVIGIGFQPGRWGDYAEVKEGVRKGEDYSVPVINTPKGEHILSAGWLPMVPLYGIDLYGDRKVMDWTVLEYAEHNEQGHKYLNSFNPIGFNIQYAYLPHIFGNNKLGYEIEFSYFSHDNITLPEGGFVPVDRLLFGLRYQREINDSWYLNARAAIGIAKAYNFKEEYKKWNEWIAENDFIEKEEEFIKGGEPGFALSAGASMQYFFLKNMFAQASMDMLFVFTEKTNIQLRPGISLGWQFRRGAETGLRLPGNGLPQFGE